MISTYMGHADLSVHARAPDARRSRPHGPPLWPPGDNAPLPGTSSWAGADSAGRCMGWAEWPVGKPPLWLPGSRMHGVQRRPPSAAEPRKMLRRRRRRPRSGHGRRRRRLPRLLQRRRNWRCLAKHMLCAPICLHQLRSSTACQDDLGGTVENHSALHGGHQRLGSAAKTLKEIVLHDMQSGVHDIGCMWALCSRHGLRQRQQQRLRARLLLQGRGPRKMLRRSDDLLLTSSALAPSLSCNTILRAATSHQTSWCTM